MTEELKFNDLKIKFRPQTSDVDVLNHSFQNDIFFGEINEFKPRKGGVIIDVGAHIGTFSIHADQIWKHHRIFAIEPDEDSFKLLQENINSNDLSNIVPINKALWSSTDNINLYLNQENWLHSVTNNSYNASIIVPATTLNELFNEHAIEFCDLIKFNCEGAEFHIIQSMEGNNFKKIGFMLILYHEDLVKGKFNRRNLTNHLKRNNFSVELRKVRSNRGWIIAKNKHYYQTTGIFNKVLSTIKSMRI